MGTPKVSVCVPVYNGEKYIEQTIKSVLEQSFTDFELVIIDDASTDKTWEILKNFSDDRIRLVKNEKNVGMVANWNCCLDNSKGEYLQILCHDDYLSEDCLEKKVKIFNNHKDISLIFNSTYIVNDNNKIVMKRRPFQSEKLFNGKEIGYRSFTQKNLYGEPSNVMFKREISKKVGYFDDRLCYAIDWDYWIKLSLMGNVYYIDDFLVYFRVSNTSATSNLLKIKEKLVQDDNQFIKNCLENKIFKLKKVDIFLHKINIGFRTYARELFFKLNSK